MSTRTVHEVERITYSFSRDELLDVLLSHGEDSRGMRLLPNPQVEWTADGVSLVYEYKSAKKTPAPKPNAPNVPAIIHEARAWPDMIACGLWGRGEGRAIAPDIVTCAACLKLRR